MSNTPLPPSQHELREIVKQELEVPLNRIFQRVSGSVTEHIIRTIVLEQIEAAVMNATPSIQRNLENEVQTLTSPPRRLTLQFKSDLSLPILTGKEIQGKGSASLEVALVDVDSNKVVESGTEAYAKVEIFLLKEVNQGGADIPESKGKKSLLVGNVKFQLNKGVFVVSNLMFRHSSKWMTRDDFKLGAKVIESFPGIHIEEAKTETFQVKDRRNEYYTNREIPGLSDDVWRLKRIAKDKRVHKLLQEQEIYTVRDFLVFLFKDPQGLKHIANMKPKDWEVLVKHARTCKIDEKMACYIDSQTNKVVVFNLVDQVLGVVSGCEYISVDKLSEIDKEDAHKLAVYAIDNTKELVYFVDEASLVCYFSSLSASMNATISQGQEHYVIAATHRHSESLHISDFEIMDLQLAVEPGISSDLDIAPTFQDFEEYEKENFPKDPFDNLIVEECDWQFGGTSLVVNAHPWKSWGVLINILSLRWVTMRKKRTTLQKLPVRKRQRVQ